MRTTEGIALFALMWQTAVGQTQLDISKQAKNADFSGANYTKPAKVGAILPGTCSAGEAFFLTTAAIGSNLYFCGTDGNWFGFSGSGNAVALQGRDVAPTLPSNGQTLTWSASAGKWQPETVSGGSGVTDSVAITVTGNRIRLLAGAKARIGAKETTLVGDCSVDTTGGTGSVWFYLGADGEWMAGTNATATLVSGSECQLALGITEYPPSAVPLAQVSVAVGVPGAITYAPLVVRSGLPIIAGANCAVAYTAEGAAQISCTPGTNGLADPLANGMLSRSGPNTTVARTIQGSSGRVTVTNGDGVSGAPSIDLAATAVTPGTYTNATISVDNYGRISAASSGSTVGRSGWGTLPVCNASRTNSLYLVTDTGGVLAHCDGTSYLYLGSAGTVMPPALRGTLTSINGATTTAVGGNIYLTGSSGADPNLRAAVGALPSTWTDVEGGFRMMNLDAEASHTCGLVVSETATVSGAAVLIGVSNAARHTVLKYSTFTTGVSVAQATMPFTNLLAVQDAVTTQYYRLKKNGANYDVAISPDRSMWRTFATGITLGFTPGYFGFACDSRGSTGQPAILGIHLEAF